MDLTEKLYADIEAARLKLETELANACERRDVANRDAKSIRGELAKLPRRPITRSKGEVVPEELIADIELTSGGAIKVRRPGEAGRE